MQSAHVYRCRTGHANWPEVLLLYDALTALVPSPVIAINRALAVAERRARAPPSRRCQSLAADPRLAEYQPYWARAPKLLAKLGANREARDAFALAIGLERDPAVRRFLQERQARLPL